MLVVRPYITLSIKLYCIAQELFKLKVPRTKLYQEDLPFGAKVNLYSTHACRLCLKYKNFKVGTGKDNTWKAKNELQNKINFEFAFKILLIFFLILVYRTEILGQIITKNKSNIGINFSSCSGNYFLLSGKRYYDGETAFICVGPNTFPFPNGYPPLIEISAFHADQSAFPVNTQWSGVIESNGHIGKFNNNNPSQNINDYFVVSASYMGSTNVVSVSINVVVISIRYEENPDQSYGFDPNNWNKEQFYPSYPQFGEYYAWKSVLVGSSDIANLVISPMEYAPSVTIQSTNTSDFPVSPTIADDDPQVVTISANLQSSSNENMVMSFYNNQQICAIENHHPNLAIAAYDMLYANVKFILIAEENDDAQVIDIGHGEPNTLSITSGQNGILETLVPLGKDDFIVGNQIFTGNDGISDCIAIGDDVQLIPYEHGKANTICIISGANNFRDTPDPNIALSDDEIEGNNITTGANGICETLASSQNSNIDKFSNFNLPDAFVNLNNIYRQAVCQWITQNPINFEIIVVNYDLNRDGKLNLGDPDTEETTTITNHPSFNDPIGNTSFIGFTDYSSGSAPTAQGFTLGIGQKKAIIFPGNIINQDSPNDLFNQTLAHELGHATFGLLHPCNETTFPAVPPCDVDDENLMGFGLSPAIAQKLRKYQWDKIHN